MTTSQQPANLPAASSAASAADLKRDVQATLAARRELGPEYDEHFLDLLVEKMTAIQQAQQPKPQLPAKKSPPHDQQLGLAICSLIFGTGLVWVAGSFLNGPGVVLALVAIIALNILFDWPR